MAYFFREAFLSQRSQFLINFVHKLSILRVTNDFSNQLGLYFVNLLGALAIVNNHINSDLFMRIVDVFLQSASDSTESHVDKDEVLNFMSEGLGYVVLDCQRWLSHEEILLSYKGLILSRKVFYASSQPVVDLHQAPLSSAIKEAGRHLVR